MDRARDWGTRIAHEAQLHEENSFITLTYRDDQLPADGGISVRDLQLFFKRLRKKIAPRKVRYYACGEYGEAGGRPHYHAILFGYQFPSLQVWRRSGSGFYLHRSPLLEELWPLGSSEIGSVTSSSGAYVARYVLKKMDGCLDPQHYVRRHPVTGELHQVASEFALMSSRPGIGGGWFDQFESDCFPSDFVVLDGQKLPVPDYYKKKLKGRFDSPASDPDSLLVADDLRPSRVRGRKFVRLHAADSTDDRLAVREEIALRAQSQFKRDLGD